MAAMELGRSPSYERAALLFCDCGLLSAEKVSGTGKMPALERGLVMVGLINIKYPRVGDP